MADATGIFFLHERCIDTLRFRGFIFDGCFHSFRLRCAKWRKYPESGFLCIHAIGNPRVIRNEQEKHFQERFKIARPFIGDRFLYAAIDSNSIAVLPPTFQSGLGFHHSNTTHFHSMGNFNPQHFSNELLDFQEGKN